MNKQKWTEKPVTWGGYLKLSGIVTVIGAIFSAVYTMTINEYQALALRTESRITTDPVPYIRVLEGLMGLNGEAGEAIDLMKKVLFQGHEFDREHMAKELGDIAWYLAVSADAIGYDLESILQMNVDKLRTRYPDGFSTEQSLHRSANDI